MNEAHEILTQIPQETPEQGARCSERSLGLPHTAWHGLTSSEALAPRCLVNVTEYCSFKKTKSPQTRSERRERAGAALPLLPHCHPPSLHPSLLLEGRDPSGVPAAGLIPGKPPKAALWAESSRHGPIRAGREQPRGQSQRREQQRVDLAAGQRQRGREPHRDTGDSAAS